MTARRLALAALAATALAAAGVVAANAYAAATGPRAADVANSRYRLADRSAQQPATEVAAYLAKPAERVLRPGILLVHDRRGLDAATAALADRLGALGYAAFAPDLYRGQAAAVAVRALWLRWTTPTARAVADIDAAVRHLQGVDTVDPERIAVVGLGDGGRWALRYAATNDRLAGVAILDGSPFADATVLGAIGASQIPTLVLVGDGESDAATARWEAALSAADVPHAVEVVDGAGGSLLGAADLDAPGPADDAWAALERWLAATLRP